MKALPLLPRACVKVLKRDSPRMKRHAIHASCMRWPMRTRARHGARVRGGARAPSASLDATVYENMCGELRLVVSHARVQTRECAGLAVAQPLPPPVPSCAAGTCPPGTCLVNKTQSTARGTHAHSLTQWGGTGPAAAIHQRLLLPLVVGAQVSTLSASTSTLGRCRCSSSTS